MVIDDSACGGGRAGSAFTRRQAAHALWRLRYHLSRQFCGYPEFRDENVLGSD